MMKIIMKIAILFEKDIILKTQTSEQGKNSVTVRKRSLHPTTKVHRKPTQFSKIEYCLLKL